jgi:hypothetical protein
MIFTSFDVQYNFVLVLLINHISVFTFALYECRIKKAHGAFPRFEKINLVPKF